MRHILFLTHWYPNKNDSQSGVFVKRHAQCVAQNNSVTVVFVKKRVQEKTYLLEEKSISERFTELVLYYKDSTNRLVNLYRMIVAYRKVFRRVAPYDLIHCNITYPVGLVALCLAKYKGKPFVVTEHWTGFLRNTVRIKFWKKWLLRAIVSQAYCVMPVSTALGKAMQNYGLKGNYAVVPNVTDTNTFVPANNTSEMPVFLHISSLKDEQKNVSGMLDVFLELKKMGWDFSLRIGGREQQSDWLRKEVEKRGLNDFVSILGNMSSVEVAKQMQLATRFVLFSNYETQGCVIAESISCGLPVIYSDLAAVKEYVPDAYGSIVPVNGKEELLRLLSTVCESKVYTSADQKKEMHTHAVHTFSRSVIANKLEAIYDAAQAAVY